jgi:hypothetical protein
VWRLGILGPRRRRFWRLVALALRRDARLVPQAVTLAILGEHFIRYTEEEVLPRLDRRVAEIRREDRLSRLRRPVDASAAAGRASAETSPPAA